MRLLTHSQSFDRLAFAAAQKGNAMGVMQMAKSAHPAWELHHFSHTHTHQGYLLPWEADWPLAISVGDLQRMLGAVKREKCSLEKV